MLLNIMEEWGGKYSTKGEAWETLKGISACFDIQLQGVLAETEKEVMPELETKADIVDEENAETSPLLANEEHNENSEKEVLAKSESAQVKKRTGIINENDTEGIPLDAEVGKEEVVTSDGTREIQGKRQPKTANVNKEHNKETEAEQDMIVLQKNTLGNVFYTKESSINKGRQTEGSTDQKFPGEASQATTERAKSGQNVHRVSEETKPSTSSRKRKDPSESSPGAESGSKQTDV